MLSHHPAKFGGQSHRGSGYIAFVVFEKRESTFV